jgi:hypothetical protein
MREAAQLFFLDAYLEVRFVTELVVALHRIEPCCRNR